MFGAAQLWADGCCPSAIWAAPNKGPDIEIFGAQFVPYVSLHDKGTSCLMQ